MAGNKTGRKKSTKKMCDTKSNTVDINVPAYLSC